ncbi:hypothetical protein [uncultured Microbacterium sp.]|uniref:hypothetical protein n=1 Tax=uncultured Microbacterium sp. TaxID=191216 RepID=UPI0028D4695E|nr:hypothetical protein [uncultured Microbacterium sp.]
MTDERTRAHSVVEEVQVWTGNAAMAALVALVERVRPHDEKPWLQLNEQLPAWLIELLTAPRGQATDPIVQCLLSVIAIEKRAADSFDFRGIDGSTYRERSEAASADFDVATRERVLEYAVALGLVEPTQPAGESYDMTLVLGGGFRSPLLRTRYAALLEQGGTDLGEIYLLGSPRFLLTSTLAEAPITSSYAPNASDEFDLMIAAAIEEFGFVAGPTVFECRCTDASTICPHWLRTHSADGVPPAYTHERSLSLSSPAGRHRGSVISASTSRPPYRPDTSDTFALWARCANPTPGGRALVVTTQVFVPFQRFEGLRRLYLPHGLHVDAVGFGADWGDRPLTAEYLLQEVLSAIRSARRLLVDAAEILLDHS